MWCASNRYDLGAVSTTGAMLESWERFSNPPYSLELVPWDCHVFVKPRKYLLTSAISTWRYCHSRGPGAASRTGPLCLPPGFGKSHGTLWEMPEQVCWLCGKIKDWCPNVTTWIVFLHLPPVTYKNVKSVSTCTLHETRCCHCVVIRITSSCSLDGGFQRFGSTASCFETSHGMTCKKMLIIQKFLYFYWYLCFVICNMSKEWTLVSGISLKLGLGRSLGLQEVEAP